MAEKQEEKERKGKKATEKIEYSDKYNDERYEYRHVIIPKDVAKSIGIFDKGRLFTEFEWRSLGIQQSRGWEHYAIHRPEPHILLFRRPLGTDPTTGEVNVKDAIAAREQFFREMQYYQK
eukprot:gene9723-10563_t